MPEKQDQATIPNSGTDEIPNRSITPSSSVPQQSEHSKPVAGPGLLVLQWLTYAFWGWTLLSLGGLIFLTIGTLIDPSDTGSLFGGGVAYLLAATIVLFLISLVSDIFYARTEKNRDRSNAGNIIMIIHAVIFALFGIGAVITSVFGLVQLLIGEGGVTGPLTAIIGGIVIALLYGATLLRTFRPQWLKPAVYVYWAVMTTVVIVTAILGVVGPVNQARLEAKDEKVASGVEDIAREVGDYTKTNGELPESLDQLNGLNDEATMLLDEKSVEYTALEKVGTSRSYGATVPRYDSDAPFSSSRDSTSDTSSVYHYKLCVEYATAKNEGSDRESDFPSRSGHRVNPQTYSHKAGDVCYDLQTDYTN